MIADFMAPSANSAGIWIACLGGFLIIINLLLSIFEKLKPNKSCLEMHQDFVTRKEFEELDYRLEKISDQLSSQIHEIGKFVVSSNQEVLKEIGEIKGRLVCNDTRRIQ